MVWFWRTGAIVQKTNTKRIKNERAGLFYSFASSAAISSGGMRRPQRNLCIMSYCRSRRNASCSAVSKPSAVTISLMLCASAMTAVAMAASLLSAGMSRTNERSILNEWIGKRFR